MDFTISVIYYLFLLLLFGYLVVYHFPQMTSSPSDSASASDPDTNDQVEELDPGKFYHHPVWPQRWHHPELTKEASLKWAREPWFKNAAGRPSHHFLTQRLTCNLPWGFIIYRTVYTSESEELWPTVLEKIAQQLKRGIRSEINGNESHLEQLIEKSHEDVILSDPNRWNAATIQQIRRHFVEYLRKIKQVEFCDEPRFASCLVIDKKSLKSIIEDERNGFLGVVDPRYSPEERYDNASYRGFMRVQIKALWYLYMQYDWDPMSALCPNSPDGWIPVYDGCYGTVQDEDGNEYPEDYAIKRPKINLEFRFD